jgi:hypothetical protein
MAFSWFKKKKDEGEKKRLYDPTQVTIRDLIKGSFVDYDLECWEVRAAFEYDWGDNFFSDEFQLATADDTVFLSVEDDDELFVSVTRKILIHDIEEDVVNDIIKKEVPPMKITYKGETYFRKSESIGHYRNVETDSWAELVSWTYFDRNQERILSIEQWGQEEFEASWGKVANEYEFSSIIMP